MSWASTHMKPSRSNLFVCLHASLRSEVKGSVILNTYMYLHLYYMYKYVYKCISVCIYVHIWIHGHGIYWLRSGIHRGCLVKSRGPLERASKVAITWANRWLANLKPYLETQGTHNWLHNRSYNPSYKPNQ